MAWFFWEMKKKERILNILCNANFIYVGIEINTILSSVNLKNEGITFHTREAPASLICEEALGAYDLPTNDL